MNPVRGLHSHVGLRMVSRSDVLLTRMGRFCLREPRCNFGSRYRTMDGSCNNRFGECKKKGASEIIVAKFVLGSFRSSGRPERSSQGSWSTTTTTVFFFSFLFLENPFLNEKSFLSRLERSQGEQREEEAAFAPSAFK